MVRSAIGGPRKHVRLSAQQDDKLNKLAAKTGITTSEHIRRAIDAYFRLLEQYNRVKTK